MKKYIVPTIKIEKVELTEMIAASLSPTFKPDNNLPTPGTGQAPAPGTEGDAKRYDAWEQWED